MKDPHLIYPGKDFDNVFPEEGSDETAALTDRQILMNEIIECCAQVAEQNPAKNGWEIAAHIRALKDKP